MILQLWLNRAKGSPQLLRPRQSERWAADDVNIFDPLASVSNANGTLMTLIIRAQL